MTAASPERLFASSGRADGGVQRLGRARRYLGLLLAGARQHGLPADWVERLRGFDLARDEREPHQGHLL